MPARASNSRIGSELSFWEDAKEELLEAAKKRDCLDVLQARLKATEGYLEERSTGAQSGRAKGESMAQVLRTRVIGQAIEDVAQAFLSKQEAILAGDYHGELVVDSGSKGVIQALKDADRKLFYASEANLRLELMGRRIISDLLTAFFEGARAYQGGKTPAPGPFPEGSTI